MIRAFLIAGLSLATYLLQAQIEAGFRPDEARDLIALCNSFTFLKEVGSDEEIIPSSYRRTYDSRSIGMDNRFQVYRADKHAAIVIRGTTANPSSWMANIYAAMIPAQGAITVDGTPIPYRFAEDEKAAVHSGYALGVALMSQSVIGQILQLNRDGIYDILITGHSQGGSLATMLRAYLENLPAGTIDDRNRFKTYAFAGPMVGNQAFATEYNYRFSRTQTSFSVVNPDDMVPNFPGGTGDGVNPINLFTGRSNSNDFRSMFVAALFQQFSDSLAVMANKMGATLLQQLRSSVGNIEMPDALDSYQYTTTGTRIEIDPVYDIPVTAKDDGESAYDPKSLQHKPYVYYRSILIMYFPEEHKKLKRLVPPGVN
ncbi:MAG: hypothetical protein EA392_02335 [Cryomorphaceae bacterium]|nr:MAG: hypothetical protein EA392_02335 [Cryomorphaceae bacterium]